MDKQLKQVIVANALCLSQLVVTASPVYTRHTMLMLSMWQMRSCSEWSGMLVEIVQTLITPWMSVRV